MIRVAIAIRSSDYQTIIANIKKFGLAGKKTAVVRPSMATLTCPFPQGTGQLGLKATGCRSSRSRSVKKSCAAHLPAGRPPIAAEPLGDPRRTRPMTGLAEKHGKRTGRRLAASLVTTPTSRLTGRPDGGSHLPSASTCGAQAVEKAKSDRRRTRSSPPAAATDLRGAVGASRRPWMTRRTTTSHKPVFIGEVKADGCSWSERPRARSRRKPWSPFTSATHCQLKGRAGCIKHRFSPPGSDTGLGTNPP